MRRILLILTTAVVLASVCGRQVWAQSGEAQAPAPGALPGPFIEEEKSPFLKNLRRFEIVAFGAFPIMLFYTNVGFDLSRYIRSGYDSYYAPWPLKNEYSYQASTSEILASIGTAALLSLSVGTVDAIIRAIRSRNVRDSQVRVDSP